MSKFGDHLIFQGASKVAVGFELTIPLLCTDALDHLATLPSTPYGGTHILPKKDSHAWTGESFDRLGGKTCL
jgi:hypothetical protein